jgi:hypothetical protein
MNVNIMELGLGFAVFFAIPFMSEFSWTLSYAYHSLYRIILNS